MKKILMGAAAFCCILLSGVTLSACSSSDDDDNKPVADDKPATVEMNYSATVTDDMLAYFDISVEYYDSVGKIKTEAITSKEWKKTVKASLPAKLGIRTSAKIKEGKDPSSLQTMKVARGKGYLYKVLTAHGGVLDFYEYNTKGDSSISGAKVKDWLERRNGVLADFLYQFTTDGKHAEEVWPETNFL
jgi:hypothetical protein